jgi:selenocysteine lyase/cysteine desulfurase
MDGMGPEAVRALRAQYMLSEDILYLNHASIGTVPRAVHEAHVAYLELCESHPSLYVWGPAWREVTEETRTSAAGLLRCDPDDLAVTHNTTEGFNVLAHGLPLRRGDEVLFSSLNHPGASVPWLGLAETRRFEVRRFEFPLEGADELDEEEVVALHLGAVGPRTRVLVLPHVDNMIGLRHPIRSLAVAAKERGVDFVLVDGAQAAGMIPLDLRGSGVDAYAMSPHKWLQSPKGLGLLYVAPHLRSRLPPMWFRTMAAREGGSARQYEDYSTRAWPAVVALGDALAFQLALGEDEKVQRYRTLRNRIRDRVDAEARLRWRSPREWPLGSMIVAVSVTGREASALAGPLFEEHGLALRAFGAPFNALRLSPNVATTDEEVDRALDALAASA